MKHGTPTVPSTLTLNDAVYVPAALIATTWRTLAKRLGVRVTRTLLRPYCASESAAMEVPVPAGKRIHGLVVGSSKPGLIRSCVGAGGVGSGVGSDVGDGVGEGEADESDVGDAEALLVISLDVEDEDGSKDVTADDDGDELTVSGVTTGSDELEVVALDSSAELYDVDSTSASDEDGVENTEEATTVDETLF
jgi:hypothetical protein